MSDTQFKILWALDAFEDSPEVFGNSARLVKSLSECLGAEIHPVYVLGPKQLNLSTELSDDLRNTYLPAANRAIIHRLRSVEMQGLKPAEVLVNRESSLRESANVLLEYAKHHEFDLVLAGTHGRKGLSRVLFGSFTEELMLQSELPVMVIGSQELKLPKGDRLRRILFPTDLREESYSVFPRVIELARKTGAQVTLLHAIPKPLEPTFQSGVFLLSGAWVPHLEFAEIERSAGSAARAIAKDWASRVSGEGVPVEVIIDNDAAGVSASILAHAERDPATLIAMAAQSGRFQTAILGSIARQIVRNASYPVWVCRASS